MFEHVNHGINLPKLTRKTTDSGRKYFTPTGNAYPSATTVLGHLTKESIIAWRKRVGAEEANKISSRASRRGTKIHKMCEDYLNNEDDYINGAMPNNIETFNVLKPHLDTHISNIWMQEEFLYSDDLECAGQVDCIAEYDGELSIIDFKTSLKLKKEEWVQNYFMQTAFYAAAFYERTGVPIKQGVIIIAVDDEPQPQVFKVNTFDYLPNFINARERYRNEVEGVSYAYK